MVGSVGRLNTRTLLVGIPFFQLTVLTPCQGVIWLSVALAIVFVVLRTFIRLHVSKQISTDDVCIYIALAILISMAVLYNLVAPTMFWLDRVNSGQEKPTPDLLAPSDFYLRCQFAIILLFWTTLWLVKLSILMFYKSMFNRLPLQITFWWVVVGFVALAYIGCWVTQLLSCYPIPTYFSLGT